MLGNETAPVGTGEVLLAARLRRAQLLLVQIPPNAAAAADLDDPHRVVYWSAKYIEEEAARLEREYSRLLTRLKVYNLVLAPVRRRRC